MKENCGRFRIFPGDKQHHPPCELQPRMHGGFVAGLHDGFEHDGLTTTTSVRTHCNVMASNS